MKCLGCSDQGLAHKIMWPLAGVFPMTDVRLELEGNWERENDNEGVLLDGRAWTECLGDVTSLVFEARGAGAVMIMWDKLGNTLQIIFSVFSWV